MGPETAAKGRPEQGQPPRGAATRAAVGVKDVRFHDLRHTAGTLATQNGATLKEVMSRLGHSTTAAAIRYQRAADERDREVADRLDEVFGHGRSATDRKGV